MIPTSRTRSMGMDIGFTGSRGGMSQDQLNVLRERLTPPNTTWNMFRSFHHGDCVGADEQAHEMMMGLRGRYGTFQQPLIVTHPPMQVRFRAFCSADRIMKPRPYLDRDRDIVLAIDLLIAAPATTQETVRSGTWYTIRRARELGKQIVILTPDGGVLRENFNETTRARQWNGTGN